MYYIHTLVAVGSGQASIAFDQTCNMLSDIWVLSVNKGR